MIPSEISRYRTIVFDCDGVLLNSNRVKTDAFFSAASAYGGAVARRLVEYHKANGGISRYLKFEWMLKNLVPPEAKGPGLDALLDAFATAVQQGLMRCDVAPGLRRLREATRDSKWFVVSGGDQSELRAVFRDRGLDEYFDGGIFGSPDRKEAIFAREIESGNMRRPAIYFGDSRYDHEAARQFDVDFVFVSEWTEFRDWRSYCESRDVVYVSALIDVLAPAGGKRQAGKE